MQVHSNTTRIVLEVLLLVFGVPVLGLVSSVVLWARSAHEEYADRRQYQRLGFGGAAFSFLVPVLVLGLNLLPASWHTNWVTVWLPLLSLAGIFTSLVAAVLLAINTRGLQRATTPLLALVATLYCTFSIFAFLAGAGGL